MARILALDDSPTILAFLEHLLGDEHELICCTDWVAANKRLHSEQVDLVIVDQQLEQFQGTFFVRAVRDFFGPKLPVVVLSGEEVESTAFEAGATAFVPKVDTEVLSGLIRRILGCARKGACTLAVRSGTTTCVSCPGGRLSPGQTGSDLCPPVPTGDGGS